MLGLLTGAPMREARAADLFARDNLVAWCIVPFDAKKRGPEERAAMLRRLGFSRLAYDWRGEHVPTFDAELDAMARHGISLDAFWVAPGELNRESQIILDVLKRHKVKTKLWVLLDLGPERTVPAAEQKKRVESAATRLAPLAVEAGKIGCSVALYNHGGWFGEPENQLAVVEKLKARGIKNVGIVYNLHHGHDHIDRLPAVLAMLKPHLVAVNLNGMDRDGDKIGRKILPLGQGSLDLDVLKAIGDSGYSGPIGILGHTQDDAEARLQDNLDGLDWLVPQLLGKPAGPRPTPRTPVPPSPAKKEKDQKAEEAATVARLIAAARQNGDADRGAAVFTDLRFGCLSCHKVGPQGGEIGPDLTTVGRCLTPELIAESVLWPGRQVKPGFEALSVATADGRILEGYKQSETATELTLKIVATSQTVRLARSDIEEVKIQGTLMPDRLADAMSADQRRDLVRFLMGLGHTGAGGTAAGLVAAHTHTHAQASFPYEREPLHPDEWLGWRAPVNRERIFDFYAKEAEYFAKQPSVPPLLPVFPGLDGGRHGHWGNQNEDVWADPRWNDTDLGSLLSGVFWGADDLVVPKGVCVRLGERGEVSACFNPETLRFEAVWKGGFVKFTEVRHGFMDGLLMDGTPLPCPVDELPEKPFAYHGFYRHGKRVVFSYRIGETEYLDAPWVANGKFMHIKAPAATHPLASLIKGGPSQWPNVIKTGGTLGTTRPYAVDTIEPPFSNPWKAPMFFGDHDFFPDGSAAICTMQGDVWRVEGLDASLKNVRWRRIATGLHQALGLVVLDGDAHVLGRDQITRLRDLNGDGETDFYECVSNAYLTSSAGHDFISGLQRDALGNFYTASGKQGILQISPDGKTVTVLATGFRNSDGLGLTPEGTLTVPNSEGDWVPTSSVNEVRRGGFYGHRGPKKGQIPDQPLVYLPRGLDNSSGAQVAIPDDRWGPLKGRMVHLSFGAGTYFLLLREKVDGQPQGAVVPMPGAFLSGAHRGRFNPKDGQLYVSGMAGWGTYTPLDGCFQRVRYTGDPVQLPVAFHAHENGVLVEFSRPLDRAVVSRPQSHFVQVWNYRYGPQYGSPELSTRHPGVAGHDPLPVRSAHVLADGRSLFLEIPDLQPVNQLHLHTRVDEGRPHDLFATVNKLAAPFTGIPGYKPVPKTIAAHPVLADLARLSIKPAWNPWKPKLADAREVTIEAGKNLTYTVTSFRVKAGEPIKLVFINPDVVPHNWALVKPGTLSVVGDLANKIIADPEAAARNYIPKSDDVLAYTDIVEPSDQFTIYFRAPSQKGRYPYLCTFPGHWMAMNGVMTVE
jgi:putative heme-binding domain-containing protein